MLRLSERHPLTMGAYALAALLAFFELAVLWQALHPNVSDDYRAYYIDRSTTCLPQPVTGEYALGSWIDFRETSAREIRPCGWDGPGGDGLHSIGETSRLRFQVGEKQNLTLAMEMVGVTVPGAVPQHVEISANDTLLDTVEIQPGQASRFSVEIPADAVGDDGFLNIRFDYPDAITLRQGMSNTMWRSIKLTILALAPA